MIETFPKTRNISQDRKLLQKCLALAGTAALYFVICSQNQALAKILQSTAEPYKVEKITQVPWLLYLKYELNGIVYLETAEFGNESDCLDELEYRVRNYKLQYGRAFQLSSQGCNTPEKT